MCLVFSTKYTEKEFYLLMFHFGLGGSLKNLTGTTENSWSAQKRYVNSCSWNYKCRSSRSRQCSRGKSPQIAILEVQGKTFHQEGAAMLQQAAQAGDFRFILGGFQDRQNHIWLLNQTIDLLGDSCNRCVILSHLPLLVKPSFSQINGTFVAYQKVLTKHRCLWASEENFWSEICFLCGNLFLSFMSPEHWKWRGTSNINITKKKLTNSRVSSAFTTGTLSHLKEEF